MEKGLKERSLWVLESIALAAARYGDVSLSEVTATSFLPGSTCERELTALRKAGLADSRPRADKRGRTWVVTDAGRQKLAEAQAELKRLRSDYEG